MGTGPERVARPRVHVVCKGDARLVTLDAEELTVVGSVSLSDVGHEVAVDAASGRAYVPLYGPGGVERPGRSGDGVDVVSLRGGGIEQTIPLPRGARAHDAAWGPDGLLHVTAEGLSSVLSVDCDAGRVVGTHPTGHPQAHMLAVTSDGQHAYTANVRPGSVSRVPLRGSSPTETLPLAAHVNRLSLSRDERHAYVADQESPRLAVIALPELRIRRWLRLPHVAFGTAPTPDGRHLVVALRNAGRLALLDLRTGDVVADVRVPLGPQRVVLDEAGRLAYTACSPADVVVAVDVRSMTVVAHGRPGPNPDGLHLAP